MSLNQAERLVAIMVREVEFTNHNKPYVCGHASQEFLDELAARGRNGWRLVNGDYQGPRRNDEFTYDGPYAHFWLERDEDGAVLDLTADQFNDGRTVEFIPRGDRRQEWYAEF